MDACFHMREEVLTALLSDHKKAVPEHVGQLVLDMTQAVTKTSTADVQATRAIACMNLFLDVLTKMHRNTDLMRIVLSCICDVEPWAVMTLEDCSRAVPVLCSSLVWAMLQRHTNSHAASKSASLFVACTLASMSFRPECSPLLPAHMELLLRHLYAHSTDYGIQTCLAQVLMNACKYMSAEQHVVAVQYVTSGSVVMDVPHRVLVLTAAAVNATAGRPLICKCLDEITLLAIHAGGTGDDQQSRMYTLVCESMVSILEAHPRFTSSSALGRCLQMSASFFAPHVDVVEYCYQRLHKSVATSSGTDSDLDYCDSLDSIGRVSPVSVTLLVALGCPAVLADMEATNTGVKFLRDKPGVPFRPCQARLDVFRFDTAWMETPREKPTDLVPPCLLLPRCHHKRTCNRCTAAIAPGQYGMLGPCGCAFHVACLVEFVALALPKALPCIKCPLPDKKI